VDALRSGLGYRPFRTGGSLTVEGIVGIHQLVGDDEGSEEQQAGFSDLTHTPDEFGHLSIDILGKAPDSGLLPVIAEDREGAPVHLNRDLAHQLSHFNARSIFARALSTRVAI
jgi:hypothetical protein